MTRVLAIEVMNDYRIQEQHYFKACEDYDECDSKRRSSVIDVSSTVLVHSLEPVGVCGKFELEGQFQGSQKFCRLSKRVFSVSRRGSQREVKTQGYFTRFRRAGEKMETIMN